LPEETEAEVVVLGFQGNVSEHVEAMARALDRLSLPGIARAATDRSSIRRATALSIPGGESTTISKLVAANGLKDEIVGLARSGRPILGTCAGLILLAKTVDGEVTSGDPGFPSVMDTSVRRNAFGRQRESFETEIELKLPDRTLKETGIFIRAPLIEETRGDCTPIGRVDGRIVAALQGNLLGTCFHPELSANSRIYEFLLGSAGLPG
jgi:5'-phosphate synthase pdxT subunit